MLKAQLEPKLVLGLFYGTSFAAFLPRPSELVGGGLEHGPTDHQYDLGPLGMRGWCVRKGLEREVKEQNVLKSPEAYTQPFCDFLTENPTVWHAVQYFEKKLDAAGFKKVCLTPFL